MKNTNRYSNATHNLTITGIMLGLALLFQFLSKFMPLVPMLMNINLSLVFIVPIFFLADYKHGMLALGIRAVVGPAVDYGYTAQGMLGHLILLVAALVFVHILLFFNKVKMFNHKWGVIIGTGISALASTIIMTLLNGLLFIPWYNSIFGTFSLSMDGALGFKSYWAIVFAVYITGNLINYGIASVVLVPVLKMVKPMLENNN